MKEILAAVITAFIQALAALFTRKATAYIFAT